MYVGVSVCVRVRVGVRVGVRVSDRLPVHVGEPVSVRVGLRVCVGVVLRESRVLDFDWVLDRVSVSDRLKVHEKHLRDSCR